MNGVFSALAVRRVEKTSVQELIKPRWPRTEPSTTEAGLDSELKLTEMNRTEQNFEG